MDSIHNCYNLRLVNFQSILCRNYPINGKQNKIFTMSEDGMCERERAPEIVHV